MAERAPVLARTYKIAEIAKQYGVTEKAVRGWIEDGLLVAMLLPGRLGKRPLGWRVASEDLDDFKRRWRDRNSQSPATDSDSAAGIGPSVGPTPRPGKLLPFQRGKLTRQTPRSGGTSS